MISNFLFHRVNPERDRLWDPMSPELFEKCIRYISGNFKVARIEDLLLSNDLNKPNKYATIMFDDGYKDNITHAAPILEKYNCKASFYIVTDSIDNNIPTWTHILEHIFQFTNIADVKINFDFLPAELQISNLPDSESRIKYVSKLKPFLKTVSHEKRNTVIDFVVKHYNDVTIPKLMMNWDDLRKLKSAGHYIGSHTISHAMLGTMTNNIEIKNELQNSANKIEVELGYFPITISYPVGSFNEETKKLSKEVGYKIGLAVKQNIFDPRKEDVFEISRIELYNEPWWKTKLRITNTLENIKSFIHYK